MFMNRYFSPRYPPLLLTAKPGLLVAAIVALLLIFGCGEETIDKPLGGSVNEGGKTEKVESISTPYYPMTLGSRWVYRNPDGSEWTREVANADFLDAHQFAHSFSHNPVLEEGRLDFFRAPLYVATPDRLVRPIKSGEIGITTWQKIDIRFNIRITTEKKAGRDVRRFGFVGSHTYTINRLERSDFTLLRPPLAPGKTWQVFDVGLRGHHNTTVFSHILEAHSLISARINEELQTVVTPAGRFEDCLEIEYYETPSVKTTEIQSDLIPKDYEEGRVLLETKIHETAATEFMRLMPSIPAGTVWLAPGVGAVKIESTEGTAVLIDYEVKAVASGQ